jgi:hypothetical protein
LPTILTVAKRVIGKQPSPSQGHTILRLGRQGGAKGNHDQQGFSNFKHLSPRSSIYLRRFAQTERSVQIGTSTAAACCLPARPLWQEDGKRLVTLDYLTKPNQRRQTPHIATTSHNDHAGFPPIRRANPKHTLPCCDCRLYHNAKQAPKACGQGQIRQKVVKRDVKIRAKEQWHGKLGIQAFDDSSGGGGTFGGLPRR